MKTILYIHHSSDASSGSAKALLHLLTCDEINHYTPLVILPEKGELEDVITKMGISVFTMEFSYAIFPKTHSFTECILFPILLLRRYIKNRIATYKLVTFCREKDIDLIHTNVSIVDIGFRATQKLGIPHVWHLREYGGLSRNYFYYYNTFNGFCKQLCAPNNYPICISKDIKRHFQQRNNPNAYVIYDGVLHANKKIPYHDKQKYILFVGKIDPQKGIEDLIDAYAIYLKKSHNNPLILKIIGYAEDLNYEKKILDKIDRLQIKSQIEFLGKQSVVQAFMSEAYAVVIPSHNEGFGYTTAEAMFSGALVIGHNDGGTKEQLDNGEKETGHPIGIRYSSVTELSDILLQITTNELSLYKETIIRGQETAVKLYSVESHIENIARLYQNIFNNAHNNHTL